MLALMLALMPDVVLAMALALALVCQWVSVQSPQNEQQWSGSRDF